MPHIRRRMQRLRSKLGHVHRGVTHRMATTLSTIRSVSAGFPTSRTLGPGQDDPTADACRDRYMQLRNTVVRALLVDEVTYEPSSRLKKSRKAVVLITGADLVLVKMTKATSTASLSNNSSSSAADGAGTSSNDSSSSAAAGGAATAAAVAAAAATGVGAGAYNTAASSRGSAGGLSASELGMDAVAGAAADNARASVLAQHELNKMVKCEVSGNKLELEFIVTGGAQFKVSAAALGLSTGSFGPSAQQQQQQQQLSNYHNSSSSNSKQRWGERLDEDEETFSPVAPAAAGAGSSASEGGSMGLPARSSSSGSQQQQHQHQHCLDNAAGLLDPAPAGAQTNSPPAAGAAGSGRPSATRGAEEAARTSQLGAATLDSSLEGGPDQPEVQGLTGLKLLPQDRAERAVSSSSDPSGATSSSASVMGSRTFARWISRYSGGGGSSSLGSTSAPVAAAGASAAGLGGSPPVMANGPSLSAVHAGSSSSNGRQGFVRSLGSSLTSGLDDLNMRSSFRPVKTDDGEYFVWVEAFTLTFSNPSMCQLAAELLKTGRSTMRQALEWLKQGLPFCPEFAMTHITELSSSRSGPQGLVAGPTPWGTLLQLPDSWVEAVAAAELPQEQPLHTALEVPDGPAAFKIHLSTPAGLAEATLVPELVAVLAQQPSRQGHVLAVPVSLSLMADQQQQPTNMMEQGEPQQGEQQLQGRQLSPFTQTGKPSGAQGQDSSSLSSQIDGGDAAACTDQPWKQQQQQQEEEVLDGPSAGEAAAAGGGSNGGSGSEPVACDKHKSSRHLTWADQQQQTGGKGSTQLAAADDASSSCMSATADGRSGGKQGVYAAAMHHSKSTPNLLQAGKAATAAASADQDNSVSCYAEVEGAGEQDQAGTPALQALPCHRYGSSGMLLNLPELSSAAREGGAAAEDDAFESDDAAAVDDTDMCMARSTSEGSSALSKQQQQQQNILQLSFVSELYAVLHVRLLPGTDDSCTGISTVALPGAGNSSCSQQLSPFAAPDVNSTGVDPVDAAASLLALPEGCMGHQLRPSLPQTPSILMLGHTSGSSAAHLHSSTGPTAQDQQLLSSAAAMLAALLCALAVLLLDSGAAPVLMLLAAAVNAACMAASAKPAWFRGASKWLLRVLKPAQAYLTGSGRQHQHQHHSHNHQHNTGLKLQHSRPYVTAAADPTGHLSRQADPAAHTTGHAPTAAAGKGAGSRAADCGSAVGVCAAAEAATAGGSGQQCIQGLRLQLLGASFVKEALGLLEEQLSAFRHMQEVQAAADEAGSSEVSSSDDLESLGPDEELQELCAEVLLSSPEPDWMTPDWRQRILAARPTLEERRKLASLVHNWRVSVGADSLLQRLPAHFHWFHKHLVLRPLLLTPSGHVVVLLKLSTLSQMHRMLCSAGLTPDSLMRYCGFIWCWLFEHYTHESWPGGRVVLLADMSGLKLGQAVGEGQVGGRALGEVCNAYPERLLRCLVLGAPNWFNMLYRLIQAQLSPSTRAKVQVCTNRAEAVAELTECLGASLVPQEFGGPCKLSYDEYPAQKELLEYVANLQQQTA